MERFRYALTAVLLLALTGGYLGSQAFALTGRAQDWTRMVEQPLVVWGALLALIAAVALAMGRRREEEDSPW